ncbi:MAG: phosphomethylpyrimidine synthase ThiC [Candidatus Omnitrophica bacterium]|nr:phosphomethylpyrimidine synthase ThiC [Candidatus Omnitrophota bacterium]MDD5310698.1 phosphomethylpyrimidine synthase ThiC [Candidatus Omnitrophota bacterium]
MTQLESAKRGKITPEMRLVAKAEGLDLKLLVRKISSGRIVIPSNILRKKGRVCGIGEGLKTKINANIGTSQGSSRISAELKKLKVAVDNGADAVMDLSTAGDLRAIRKAILRASPVPVGTVPIYEAAVGADRRKRPIYSMTADEMFAVIEGQAGEGVDFFTIHCGVTRKAVDCLKRQGRVIGVVSRGGAIMVEWMAHNRRENPFYEEFDRVLEIARKYDVTLSLGDGMRPGCLADASDRAQIQELMTLGELSVRAKRAGVQVMIEGPGHVPINQIEANIMLEKDLCHGAPFYVLGPLVTDIAPGYDHITSAIGGALAAAHGADFICYVTPSEHLGLPSVEDVKTGVISARIAAHAADVAKGVKGALDRDIAISAARKKRDWKKQFALAIDPSRAKEYRNRSKPAAKDVCTMCGQYCSMKISEEYLG